MMETYMVITWTDSYTRVSFPSVKLSWGSFGGFFLLSLLCWTFSPPLFLLLFLLFLPQIPFSGFQRSRRSSGIAGFRRHWSAAVGFGLIDWFFSFDLINFEAAESRRSCRQVANSSRRPNKHTTPPRNEIWTRGGGGGGGGGGERERERDRRWFQETIKQNLTEEEEEKETNKQPIEFRKISNETKWRRPLWLPSPPSPPHRSIFASDGAIIWWLE